MQQTIPAPVGFQVIEHDRPSWASVAQLAFRKLTLHASPDVRPAFSLQKLPAIDGGVGKNVLHLMTGVAFEDVAVLRIAGHDTLGKEKIIYIYIY